MIFLYAAVGVKAMKILVVGSGGREHALAWKLSKSPQVKQIYCAPGNAGTARLAENVALAPDDIKGLLEFAGQRKVDLTVVGPEKPLTLGIVDEIEKQGLKIFGPNRKAAELEESKVFAKQFMERHRIPTGRYRIAPSADKAREILKSGEFSYPLVVKADGLAAGKGVIICPDQDKAREAVDRIMVQKEFGASGNKVLIEEFLRGQEVSFIVLTDGAKVLPLVTTMDHKAVFDGGEGPNTGGMGAISPSPFITQKLYSDIVETIVFPVVTRMLEEGRKYRGALYFGLMLTDKGPRVLEFNCRFGDPETQPQMIRLESDLAEILMDAIEDNVLAREAKWSTRPSGCVVLTSGGYPDKYEKGKVITGVDKAEKRHGIVIFHAGTALEGGKLVTSGGRVLGVCASEPTLAATMTKIYETIEDIKFEGMHYRTDIGALKEEES
jgi:phosphoribosylamine--glycine ligase